MTSSRRQLQAVWRWLLNLTIEPSWLLPFGFAPVTYMYGFPYIPGTLIAQAVSIPPSPEVLIEFSNIPNYYLALGFSGAAISASFALPST